MDRALLVLLLCAAVGAVALFLRRRRDRFPRRIDPGDLGLPDTGAAVVGFSSPYCLPCQRWEAALEGAGVGFRKVDLSQRPELARSYGIRATPLVLAVRLPDGEVLEAYQGEPEPARIARLAEVAR